MTIYSPWVECVMQNIENWCFSIDNCQQKWLKHFRKFKPNEERCVEKNLQKYRKNLTKNSTKRCTTDHSRVKRVTVVDRVTSIVEIMLDGYVKPKINADNADCTVKDVINRQEVAKVWMLCVICRSWYEELQGRCKNWCVLISERKWSSVNKTIPTSLSNSSNI